ncbi:MAG TPA: penicillin-binding protein activator [Patescibacteria group bacterium]|nr:penicillin-binding protein activator [Patescibacteria group bacterium]
MALIAVLLLAGCMRTGYSWNSTPPPAQAAPSSISPVMANQGQQMASNQNFDITIGNERNTAMAGQPSPAPASVATAPNATMSAPVKVAILLPLSGSHADIGQALLNAAQLALFDMGSHSFELVPRDTGGTAQGAEKAMRSALSDGAQLILGPLFAPQVKACSPIAAQANVNMIAFSTDWSLAGGNTYIMGFLPFGQVQRIVNYAASRGLRRIGVLAPSDEYGNAVMNAYNAEARHDGITTVDIVRFPAGRVDLSSVVSNFDHVADRTANPAAPPPFDAVLIAVGGNQARTIANQLSTDGLNPEQVRRLGIGLWDDQGLSVEPGMQSAWFAAPSPDLRRTFEKRYTDTYGTNPPRLATLGYDATALAAVLARNGDNGSGIFSRAAITNPNGFAGVDGVFRFLPNGLAERGLGVLTFHGGTIAVEDQAPRTFQMWNSQ